MKRFFVFLLFPPWLAFGAPNVVVSIAPVHSLVAFIMQGAGEPHLLLPPTYSPHTYQLKPSVATLLNQADIVIWLGPQLEHALEKSLKNLAPHATTLQLTQMEALTLLPYANHDHGGIDPHLWLDPQNAKKAAEAIAILLSAKDPASKKIYQQNSRILAEKLDALDHELNKFLWPMRELPFLVYHDALQYLNRRYGLKQIGVVNPNPDMPLKARRMYEISRIAFVKEPLCLFGEPQADQKAIAQLAEELKTRLAIIDTLGSSIQPGPQLYGQMMRNLARAIRQCLASEEQ